MARSAGSHAATSAHSRLVVAAAVLDSLERPTALLCAARSYPPALAGRFELPGGKVEPGEEPVQALARELSEEIGLRVRLGRELCPPRSIAVPPPGSSQGSALGPAQGSPQAPDDQDDHDDAPAWPAMSGYRIRVWLAEPADPADRGTAGADHQQLRWTALDQIGALDWLDADIPIVEAIQAM